MLRCVGVFALFLVVALTPAIGQTMPSSVTANPPQQSKTKSPTPAPTEVPRKISVAGPVTVNSLPPVTINPLPPVSTEPKRDWVDYFTLGIAVLVLLVGYFGVRYAKKTLGEISIQTKRLGEHAKHLEQLAEAAKDNAAAAAANADSVKRSTALMAITERAWIVEELSFPHGPLPFVQDNMAQNVKSLAVGFELRNAGKSAAKILNFALRFHAVKSLNLLPPEPFYEGAPHAQSFAGDGVMLMPVAATKVPTGFVVEFENGGHFLTRQDALDINGGQVELVVYGKVEYQSLQEKHVNQFCYVWYRDRGVEGDNRRFRKGGPFKYNSHS
jgi:hypothetical protein